MEDQNQGKANFENKTYWKQIPLEVTKFKHWLYSYTNDFHKFFHV